MTENIKEKRLEAIKIDEKRMSVKDFLNNDFLEKIESVDEKLTPIAIVFLAKNKEKAGISLIISHESSTDIDNRIIMISSEDKNIAKKIVDII